jgi:hypothetical protein
VSIYVGAAQSTPGSFQPEQNQTEPAPRIYAVESNLGGSTTFRGYKNEYLCLWFETTETGLKRDRVLVQVDDQDAPAVFLGDVGAGRWQINTRLHAGLAPGSHRVRVRTSRSAFSGEISIQFEP